MSASKLKGIFILDDFAREKIYSPSQITEIENLVEISASYQTSESIQGNLHLLKDIEVVFSGWGGPKINQTFLNAAPNLKAVFYGAGSVRSVVTPVFWKAGISITSAVSMNAIPVSEYALSQILFCLKLGWQHNHLSKMGQSSELPVHGAFQSTIGLIGMGAVAKLVRNLLLNHDIKVLAYDPYMDEKSAKEWKVELVSLQEVFERSSVVSLHTPDLPATEGMIHFEHFNAMPQWASFINTARSATVRHSDLCDVLEKRPDLWAVLDVTECVTEEERNRLLQLPNVSITPHIAGSLGPECYRMGQLMVDEVTRLIKGEPLKHQLTEERASIMA